MESGTAETLMVTRELIDDPDFIEQLAIDYCALFIGPKEHLPPYQSVWEDGQLQTDTVDSIESFAEAVHFKSTEDVMADHLGYQLQLMGHITQQLSTRSDNTDLVDLAKEYFKRHLSWSDRLLSAAGRKSTTDFYNAMVGLTRDLLASEREYWGA